MARRSRRRWLVVTVYVVIAASIAGAGFVNLRWPRFISPTVFLIPIFVTIFFNSFVFGGLERWGRGLVKPFYGNKTLSSYGMEGHAAPGYFRSKYLNDELDLRRRNEAHWRAYRWIYPIIGLAWWIALMKRGAPQMPDWVSSFPFDILLCCFLTALICLYATLPQAILLWTEPDMEEPR
ncbi:MAG: hypothetical protein WBE74_20310 [Terracidiphilus sp.]